MTKLSKTISKLTDKQLKELEGLMLQEYLNAQITER